MRLQLQRIDVDHDLAIFPAVGRRHRGARDTGNLVANLELQIIVQLSFVESLAIYGEQANGKARSIHLHDDGRERAFGQAPQVGHGKIGNLGDVCIGVGARLKINLDQAHAGHRTRFHVIDAAAKGEESFEGIGDVRFDLLRGHPTVKGGDEDNGNIDGRKHVDGHLREAGESQDTNEKADDNGEVGMANREGWHVYSILGASTSFGETSWPSLY